MAVILPILEELNAGSLIATDQDPEAIRFLKNQNSKLRRESVFTKLVLANYKLFSANDFDGILADIGVSSYQLDTMQKEALVS